MKWIYHEHEAQVTYSLTNDRQQVIYWATNLLLARVVFYFDSNTQETAKIEVYPTGVSSFLTLYKKKSCQEFLMLYRRLHVFHKF